MKIAIMQPYLFPYIGYFQLINAVDEFIIYDDVNYIKQGWVNRNNILLNGETFQFTLPLDNASSFKKINNTKINTNFYGIWCQKFFKTIRQAYGRAPNFLTVSFLIEKLLLQDYENISQLNTAAIIEVCALCKIETKILETSATFQNDNLKSEARVLDICEKKDATTYINPIGGKLIYDKETFSKKNIQLQFLNSQPVFYNQNCIEFTPNLSIIDLLMFADHNQIGYLLNQYKLT